MPIQVGSQEIVHETDHNHKDKVNEHQPEAEVVERVKALETEWAWINYEGSHVNFANILESVQTRRVLGKSTVSIHYQTEHSKCRHPKNNRLQKPDETTEYGASEIVCSGTKLRKMQTIIVLEHGRDIALHGNIWKQRVPQEKLWFPIRIVLPENIRRDVHGHSRWINRCDRLWRRRCSAATRRFCCQQRLLQPFPSGRLFL
mmetsp:Transcript_55155/g.87425  ORF Transcript_55155/g.87425 Transcript_55155/m.87425 type:complete len:202 (-) Transcript_55155:2302-2907(-)